MIETYTEKEPFIGEMKALVTLPDGFDASKESLPIIFFFHGKGERRSIESIWGTGLPMLFHEDQNYRGLRVITVSPWCPEPYIWMNLHLPAFDFIEKAVKHYNADESRISVTGLSMGGYMTWDLITMHPGYFSAAAPICGGGIRWMSEQIVTPIRAFHGSKDDAVPIGKSIEMIELAAKNGTPAELTVFPGVDHCSWNKAYMETNVIEWLAGSRRTEK